MWVRPPIKVGTKCWTHRSQQCTPFQPHELFGHYMTKFLSKSAKRLTVTTAILQLFCVFLLSTRFLRGNATHCLTFLPTLNLAMHPFTMQERKVLFHASSGAFLDYATLALSQCYPIKWSHAMLKWQMGNKCGRDVEAINASSLATRDNKKE